jgi:hypothetical protein
MTDQLNVKVLVIMDNAECNYTIKSNLANQDRCCKSFCRY